MAKKKEQKSKVKSRVLTKVLGGTVATIGASVEDGVTFVGGQGWDSYNDVPLAQTIIYCIKTIDLSGYTKQEKTLFPQSIIMQDMDTVPVGSTGWPTLVKRATLVSTTPISEADLINVSSAIPNNTWHLPGSNPSTHSLDHVLLGRMNVYLTLSTYAGIQLSGQTTWGSGASTAANKIWVCDAYLVPTIANASLPIPDQAFVLPSLVAKEPDLEYIMRLARSTVPIERS